MLRTPSLEDELGDVLEKALKLAGLREWDVAARTGIEVNRIKDALDYRYDLGGEELRRLARVLALNEEGLCALAEARYPQPEAPALPFCLHPIGMPYGVGVVNAYLVRLCHSPDAVLIDSGSCTEALRRAWPPVVRGLQAHLVTHWASDHAGGCADTMKRFGLEHCFGPGPARPGARVLPPGSQMETEDFRIEIISTPGPSREHYCYCLQLRGQPASRKVLFSGDLIFCGSIGGGFFDTLAVQRHARRLWESLPGGTVIAPGHGPLTTVEIEREFNPFSRG